jgi:MerR family transcriptional regulator, thiopeptide resistance regulator
MLSVTELARSCGLSRSTILYYESIGLLKAAGRTSGSYRCYGEKELARLRQICTFREAGLTLADIANLLERGSGGNAAAVLQRRLEDISGEIERLRGHQRAILALLKHQTRFRRTEAMDKNKWTEIMRASGFTDDDMHRWHSEFEKAAPQDHEEFLAYLKIEPGEIARIREWSSKLAAS